MKIEKKRIAYLDVLRIVSMFFIVLIHVSGSMAWYNTSPKSRSWQLLNFLDGISRFSVPIFLMISGCIFLNLNRKVTIDKLFHKNIKRIIIAFFTWSLVYALYVYWAVPGMAKSVIVGMFFAGHYHMWFLPCIIGMYLITPLLRYWFKDEGNLRYFLILTIIFAILIPSVLAIFKAFKDVLPAAVWHIMKKVQTTYLRSTFEFPLGLTIYFVLGYYLDQHQFDKLKRYWLYGITIIVNILTTIASGWLSLHFNKQMVFNYSYNSINNFLMATAIFVFIKQALNKKTVSNNSLLVKWSNLMFAVYLVHVLFIHILIEKVHVNILWPNGLIGPFLVSIMIFILSNIVAIILSRIPLVNKYCM